MRKDQIKLLTATVETIVEERGRAIQEEFKGDKYNVVGILLDADFLVDRNFCRISVITRDSADGDIDDFEERLTREIKSTKGLNGLNFLYEESPYRVDSKRLASIAKVREERYVCIPPLDEIKRSL